MKWRQLFNHRTVRRSLRVRVATAVAVPIASVGMLAGVAPTTVSAQTTITCELQVQNPHNSTHVPANVNVVATITCDAPVSSLSINVQLWLDNVQVASGSNANGGQAFIQANAATTCVPGLYFGTAQGTVVFPPGFVPPSESGSVQSPSVPLTCT